MDKRSITQRFKQLIALIGWSLFLWGNETTEEQYWEEIYQQEKAFLENKFITED